MRRRVIMTISTTMARKAFNSRLASLLNPNMRMSPGSIAHTGVQKQSRHCHAVNTMPAIHYGVFTLSRRRALIVAQQAAVHTICVVFMKRNFLPYADYML